MEGKMNDMDVHQAKYRKILVGINLVVSILSAIPIISVAKKINIG